MDYKLDCSNCPSLVNIPVINELQTLYCDYCPRLMSLPVINGLQELVCSFCPLLTNIPHINTLRTLYCCNSPLLYIPRKYRKLLRFKEKSKIIGLKIKQKCKYIREKTKIKTLLRDKVLPQIKYSLSEYNYQMNQPVVMNCIFQYF